jgi:peptide deformylase
MAIRNILTDDPALRMKSREVTVFDARLHQLLDDMLETMREVNGVGLAGVQAGVLRRVAIVDMGKGGEDDEYEEEIVELINPVITGTSQEMQCGPEGCLSYPGLRGTVERPMRVTVRAQDRHGNLFEITGEELSARAFCHEIDHMDGIIFQDHATELFEVDDDEDE